MSADTTYAQSGTGIYRKQGDQELRIGSAATLGFDPGSSLSLDCLAGLTALAGGGQAGATPLTGKLNQISTVATIADSAELPPAVAGTVCLVANAAANSANVFPSTGDAINGGAANAAYALAGGHNALFFCPVAGHWYAISGT